MRATILAAAGAALVLLVVLQQLVQSNSGPLPLVAVFELHVLLLGGGLAVGSLIGSLGTGRAGAWVRLVALAVLVVVVVRAGGELWSSTEPELGSFGGLHRDDQLQVMSWNLEMDSKLASD